MPAERVEPDSLTPAELDVYLARGWYRIDYGMITTDLLSWQGELRSTLWTRLDVRDHRWQRSLRKLMTGNDRRFQVRRGELVIDDAREDLYARYLEKVGHDRAESLDAVIGGERGRALFDTRELSVWQDDRLVAFSWFDLGESSVQSLIGVYDPAFSKHSLGLYTMLLEIRETAALGKQFHYAGYVLGEPSSMDYKLRVTGLQFFDPRTSTWLPEPPFPRTQSPAEVLRNRLEAAESALQGASVEVVRYLNPALTIRGLLEKAPRCPPQPLLLACGMGEYPRTVLVAWEPIRGVYALLRARAVVATLERFAKDGETYSEQLLLFFVEAHLGEHGSPEEVAQAVTEILASMALPGEEDDPSP